MIETIFFDVDGTVYDESYPKAIAELLLSEFISSKCNRSSSEVYNTFREIKSGFVGTRSNNFSKNNRMLWFETLLKHLQIASISYDELNDLYWNAVLERMEPYIDFLHMLPWLKRNFDLYVLTDESISICQNKLQHLGLDKTFIKIFSSEQVGTTKPETALFDFALSNISQSPENIAIIGDNPSADIAGGNISRLFTIWLRRGKYYYYPKSEVETPNCTITNYVQLPSLINGKSM